MHLHMRYNHIQIYLISTLDVNIEHTQQMHIIHFSVSSIGKFSLKTLEGSSWYNF